VVKLPQGCRFKSNEFLVAVSEIRSHTFEKIEKAMNDPRNWVDYQDQKNKTAAQLSRNQGDKRQDTMAFLLATDDEKKSQAYEEFLKSHKQVVWRSKKPPTRFLRSVDFPINIYFFYRSVIRHKAQCIRFIDGHVPRNLILPQYRSEKTYYKTALVLSSMEAIEGVRIDQFPKWENPQDSFKEGQQGLLRVVDIFIKQEENSEDARYQQRVEDAPPASLPKGPQPAPPQFQKSQGDGWLKNPAMAKRVLVDNNYECAVDSGHGTFDSARTGRNYVEAHHLIPMKLQGQFSNSLDVPANIISLCPNCHRKFHYARKVQREEIIKHFYAQRARQLKDYNIQIDLDVLIKAY
jgi:hypothetical protein